VISPGIENAWSALGARRPWQGSSSPHGMTIPTVWPVLENSLHLSAAAASAPSQVGQVGRVQTRAWMWYWVNLRGRSAPDLQN
jgi:hypothetical protein